MTDRKEVGEGTFFKIWGGSMGKKQGLPFSSKDRGFEGAAKAFNSIGTPLVVTGRKGSGRLHLASCVAERWYADAQKDNPLKRRHSVYVISSSSRIDIGSKTVQSIRSISEDLNVVLLITESPDEWCKSAKVSQRSSPDLFILDDIDSHEQADTAVDLVMNGYKAILVTTGSVGSVKGDNFADMILRMLRGDLPATSVPILDTSCKVEANCADVACTPE